EDFLGVFGRCEYDLIDGDGKNITTSPDVSRQWTDDAYVITLASGFADGDYTAKPCGIKGDGVEYAAGENIEIDGNTISASFSSFPGGTVTVGATSFIASTRASADLSDYMHFFHNSEGAIDITISMNEEAYEISADLRDVESFSDVAAVLQEEIRSLGEFYGGNPAWTGATVEYTNGQFSLTPGIVTEVSVRSTLDGGDYFLGNTIGWVPGTDPVVRKPSACVPISAGTKYVVPEAIGSLTIPSTATSDSESEITWTFAGGTTTPQFSYFQDLGIVGSLPTFAAGKSYLASIKGGKMVVTEYTPGRGVFELLVKTTSANEPWGFAPYWRAGGGCQVNWGDGTVEYAPTSGQVFSHSYLVPGDHTVKIIGSCYRVVFGATGNEPMQTYRNKVYGCNFNWPALGTLTDMSSLFHTCSHLAGAGFTNVPDTVTRLSYAFDGIKALIKLTKLPPDIEDTKQAFGSATTAVASNVICDLGDLVANAPLGGYASLVNISQMFLKSGAGITGSAADFIAACAPNVDALRAFEGCPNVTDVP
ncbi:MAG: hypothetical protein MJ016_06755, partial [Victivallaceae bacterium]|nr:hypothetical protein [Victivallaceae bacterium]